MGGSYNNKKYSTKHLYYERLPKSSSSFSKAKNYLFYNARGSYVSRSAEYVSNKASKKC
jgi:hypothetical protein